MHLKTKTALFKILHILFLAVFFYNVCLFLSLYTVAYIFPFIFFSVMVYLGFRLENSGIYEWIMDFSNGFLLVAVIWFIFSLGPSYIFSYLPQFFQSRNYLVLISSIAGIVGILLAFFIALRSKRRAFIAGVVVGGVLPLFLSGSCMLGGY